MGQLVARFRQWCEKLKTPEKFKNGELNRLDMDQDDITTSERMEKGEEELNKEDADLKPVVVLDKKEEEDVQDDSEMENKLGLDVEIMIKNQNKRIDEHKVRIEKLEHSMENVSQKMEEQKEKDLKASENREKTEEEETNNQRELLQKHSRILDQHEQKLQSQSNEMQTLRQKLDETQGVRQRTPGAEGKQRNHTEKYDQLEKEVKLQLEQQQRLLDNLFAGFFVAFIIVVVICMLPKPDFSLPDFSKQHFLDIFWAALSGLGLSAK